MTERGKHDEQLKPYEPPAVRELGKVTEVTRGAGTPGLADLYVASV